METEKDMLMFLRIEWPKSSSLPRYSGHLVCYSPLNNMIVRKMNRFTWLRVEKQVWWREASMSFHLIKTNLLFLNQELQRITKINKNLTHPPSLAQYKIIYAEAVFLKKARCLRNQWEEVALTSTCRDANHCTFNLTGMIKRIVCKSY